MGDTLREANSSEVSGLFNENEQLQALVAEPRPGPGPWPFRPRGGRTQGAPRAGRWRENLALKNRVLKKV